MRNSFTSLAISICVLLYPTCSIAQAIRDLSLSPAETANQPSSSSNGFKNNILRRSEQFNSNRRPSQPIVAPESGSGLPSNSFMEGYCDPTFISMLANNAKYYGQEQCLQQIRDDTCARFKALPSEVAEVMDDAIGCLFSNSNGFAVDKHQKIVNESIECAESYVQRINMLKKYYTDYYTNYALLFMPDDVLDTPGRCVNRNEGRMPILKK